jgi:hypothetical protein
MTDTAREYAEQTLGVFAESKRVRVRRSGGPYDLLPMLDCCWERPTGRERRIALVADRDLIPTAVQRLRQDMGWLRPRFVAFLADAWWRQQPADEPLPEKGDLSRAVAAGDLSIDQALTVMAVDTKTGDLDSATLPYGYDDQGDLVFRDADWLTDGPSARLDGAVADHLRALVRVQP